MITDQNRPDSSITDATLNLRSLEGRLDTTGYPSPFSDIVALMVFDHQMRMMNLLTRVGWEVRLANDEHRLDLLRGPERDVVNQVVDLSGEDKSAKYARLSSGDRQAIMEILRDTKTGLPDYFRK